LGFKLIYEKEAKKQIADKIANLIQIVGLRSEEQESEHTGTVAEDDFEDIDFDDLIKAIEFSNCVLFVGTEISVDGDGKSLHHEFFKKICNKKRHYYETEGIFMPGSETRLVNPAREYYSNQFQDENIVAKAVLKKLAQIPFELIVSLTPDDTMHQIFANYNIHKQFNEYIKNDISAKFPFEN